MSAKTWMIWSESLGEMVVRGFRIPLKGGGYHHYTWNDLDCVYYVDDYDESCYMDIPKKAILDTH